MTRYGENAMLGDGMSFDAERAGSGTREWAEHSHNIGLAVRIIALLLCARACASLQSS